MAVKLSNAAALAGISLLLFAGGAYAGTAQQQTPAGENPLHYQPEQSPTDQYVPPNPSSQPDQMEIIDLEQRVSVLEQEMRTTDDHLRDVINVLNGITSKRH